MGAGWFLRLVERLSAVGYVVFTLFVAYELILLALDRSMWLLILAIPVLLTAFLLVPSLFLAPEHVLRLDWPLRFRAWHSRHTRESRPIKSPF